MEDAKLLLLWLLFGRLVHFVECVPFLDQLLVMDSMPCHAEALKMSTTYTCDQRGNVICLEGWTNVENLCSTPVCQFSHNSSVLLTCDHGTCIAPDTCACQIGWEGYRCQTCLALPGCKEGHCQDQPFQCICDDPSKWTGDHCDKPVCKEGCVHGHCQSPGECLCETGWAGENCDVCQPLPGCQHGSCRGDQPLTCQCDPGWLGPLCDCPQCKKGCDLLHGFCTQPNECLCAPGWSGANCNQCLPHPGCPASGICYDAWDCYCDEADNKYCAVRNRSKGIAYNLRSLHQKEACFHYNKRNKGGLIDFIEANSDILDNEQQGAVEGLLGNQDSRNSEESSTRKTANSGSGGGLGPTDGKSPINGGPTGTQTGGNEGESQPGNLDENDTQTGPSLQQNVTNNSGSTNQDATNKGPTGNTNQNDNGPSGNTSQSGTNVGPTGNQLPSDTNNESNGNTNQNDLNNGPTGNTNQTDNGPTRNTNKNGANVGPTGNQLPSDTNNESSGNANQNDLNNGPTENTNKNGANSGPNTSVNTSQNNSNNGPTGDQHQSSENVNNGSLNSRPTEGQSQGSKDNNSAVGPTERPTDEVGPTQIQSTTLPPSSITKKANTVKPQLNSSNTLSHSASDHGTDSPMNNHRGDFGAILTTTKAAIIDARNINPTTEGYTTENSHFVPTSTAKVLDTTKLAGKVVIVTERVTSSTSFDDYFSMGIPTETVNHVKNNVVSVTIATNVDSNNNNNNNNNNNGGFKDDFFGSDLVNGSAILGTETITANPFSGNGNLAGNSSGNLPTDARKNTTKEFFLNNATTGQQNSSFSLNFNSSASSSSSNSSSQNAINTNRGGIQSIDWFKDQFDDLVFGDIDQQTQDDDKVNDHADDDFDPTLFDHSNAFNPLGTWQTNNVNSNNNGGVNINFDPDDFDIFKA